MSQTGINIESRVSHYHSADTPIHKTTPIVKVSSWNVSSPQSFLHLLQWEGGRERHWVTDLVAMPPKTGFLECIR